MVAGLDAATTDMCAEGSPVWLLMMLAVPTDEVLYGVFAAESESWCRPRASGPAPCPSG